MRVEAGEEGKCGRWKEATVKVVKDMSTIDKKDTLDEG